MRDKLDVINIWTYEFHYSSENTCGGSLHIPLNHLFLTPLSLQAFTI